jgi:TnpA family transposase
MPDRIHIVPRKYMYHRCAHPAPAFSVWGNGTTSSSDGQFFRTNDRVAKLGDANLHCGSELGSKFYSHLSDQYDYFCILPISPTENEAAYVLDGLLDQDTILDIQEHFTGMGGTSGHVLGLFALIGKRFAPRLRNLKDRKLHMLEKGVAYSVRFFLTLCGSAS